MIDFPASPTTNQIFTVGGTTWRYNGASWAAYTGSLVGDITSVVAGTGLTGGGTSGDVTLNLANTAVAAGSYTYATLTVDAQGRLTAASNGTTPGTVTSITAGTGLTGGTITASGTVALSVPVSVANGGTGATTTAGAPWLPLTGGQLNPGGVLIGAAGTVPATGSMLLNANTVAPPAALPGGTAANLYVVGADGGAPELAFDAFTTSTGSNLIYGRRSRGTAASPTAVQNNDSLLYIAGLGRGATSYNTGSSGASINFQATENWTDAAQGTRLFLGTTPNGTTSQVNSLILAGNLATVQNQLVIGSTSAMSGWYPFNSSTDFGANCFAVGGASTSYNPFYAFTNWGSLEIGGLGTGTWIELYRINGTYSAPTPVQNNQGLGGINFQGTFSTTVGPAGTYLGAQMFAQPTENWSASNRGCMLAFQTTPNGTNAKVNSLLLSGNTATFSGSVIANGTVTIPANAPLWLNGATSGTAGRLLSDGTSFYATMPAAGGSFNVQNTGATNNILAVDNSGNLTILGATATKASGTTWANPSSRDIKTDIKSYDKGLQAVLALQPRTYRFREDSGFSTKETHIGLVHDETAHMPELHTTAVIGGTSDKPGREVDALDCSAVTFALCNAIRELKAEIDSLKSQLSEKA